MLRDKLKRNSSAPEFLEAAMEKIADKEQVIIFGAGIGGEGLYQILEERGMAAKVAAFSDNNNQKIGGRFFGKTICGPDQIVRQYPQAFILVASTAFDMIKQQLHTYGIEEDRIVYCQVARLDVRSNGDREFIWKHIDEFEEAYDLLVDRKSREIYENLLNYRITKQLTFLDKLSALVDEESDQYFDRVLIPALPDGGFVDCGSYTGDTVAAFRERFGEEAFCYCFEADPGNYEILNRSIAVKPGGGYICNAKTYHMGVWSEKGELSFNTDSSANGGGCIQALGGQRIPVDTLDHMLSKERIGFIKMDIEGSELQALKGAEKIIKEQLPVLAVCVYHKPEDFYAIPLYIRSCSAKYQFYFRHYRYGQSETVCYAIPTGR